MEYREYKLDEYNLHFLKTDKFKSIYISTVFINKFNKENLTKNFILRKLLTSSSKKLKNETEVTKKVSELYNSGLSISNDVINNTITTNFDMEALEDKYTEDGLLENALNYYFDTIFYPNIIDNKFEKTNYDLAINNAKVYYESEKENKNKYAYDNAFLLLDEEFLKYNRNGYMKDLENITRENICEYYNKLIDTANVNIFVIGSFDDEKVINIIKNNVKDKFKKNKNYYEDIMFNEKPNLIEKEQTEKNNQSILVMIYKILDMTERERNVIIPIFNRIFGLGTNSKLFKNVREKNSLCYDIRSTISRSSIMTVQSGIDFKNKDKTVKLIKEELENMKKGNITQDEFNEAKEFRRKSLKQFDDYNDSILYIKQSNILFKNDDLEERKRKLDTVTIDEVVELSKKIELNVIYLLKGDNENGQD